MRMNAQRERRKDEALGEMHQLLRSKHRVHSGQSRAVLSELQHDSFKNLQLMLSGLLRARAVGEAPDGACVSIHKAMPVLSGTMAA